VQGLGGKIVVEAGAQIDTRQRVSFLIKPS